MDTSTDAAPASGAAPDIVQIPAPNGSEISARDAARSVVSFRLKAREGEEAKAGTGATSATEPAEQGAAAEAPAGAAPALEDAPAAPTDGADAPATEAPIEPPKSWDAAARDRFKALPRETQSFLAEREEQQAAALQQTQSEAAQHRQALEAERMRAEQARVAYENAVPSLLGTLQQQHANDFSDIRTVMDVERLAREDWPRYVAFDTQQKRIGQLQQQLAETAVRQGQERHVRFQDAVAREQALLIEKNPELADPVKRAKLTQAADTMLREIGFSEAELGDFFHGRRELNLHDHRVQMLIRDGVRLRDAQKAARQAAARPVPAVQRPGAAQPRGAAHEAAVQNLARRLDQSGSIKDAARLLAERRKAR